MGHKLKTDDLKNYRTAIHICEQNDIPVRQCGPHAVAKWENISVAMPRGSGDYAPGTRKSIQKSLARIIAEKAAKVAAVAVPVVLLALVVFPFIAS